MQEALILKLIILALAVTFIAVIIALVLSFNVTQKLMKHNANLVGQVKESDKQQASTRHR
jgi:ABC-type phosphate/phosphonate transport system permease subunit